MHSGLDEFKALLRDVHSISVWAVGAGLGTPFVGAFAALAPPPFPKSIALVTAMLELIVLILVFQFFASASRKRVNKGIVLVGLILAVTAISYVFVFYKYTFVVPTTEERGVKGFVCTDEARRVYGDGCQENTDGKLAEVEYDASKLWKTWSIDQVTRILTLLWLSSFAALSFIIGLFVIFQTRQHARVRAIKPSVLRKRQRISRDGGGRGRA